MNTNDNPYSILRVSQDADDDTIKKAYRQAAKLYHPDKQTNEEDRTIATERFAKIADAYALLNDPVRRYDWRQANEKTTRNSTSRNSPVPNYRSSATKTGAPAAARKSSLDRSQRSTGSSACSRSTRSSSSTGRRKSRVNAPEFKTASSQPSQGRRASTNLPARESGRKPVRRTASSGSNMARVRNSTNEPTVRSPAKPKRPSQTSGFNATPRRSMATEQSYTGAPTPAEKGRRKSRSSQTEPGAASIPGRRMRRVA